jgi:hypothetical protein
MLTRCGTRGINKFNYRGAFDAGLATVGMGSDGAWWGDEDLNDHQNVMAGFAWQQNCVGSRP